MEVDPPQQQSETSTTPVAVSKPRSEWAQRLVVLDKILGGGILLLFTRSFSLETTAQTSRYLKIQRLVL